MVDDAEIERVQASYPIVWEDLNAKPDIAFAGCPHFSNRQLVEWTDRLTEALERNNNQKVTVPTIFCAAPDVRAEFEKDHPDKAQKLKEIGVTVSGLCPLSYTSNPLTDKSNIITCSNKLRYYSRARFYSEKELVEILTGGEL